MNFTLHPEAAAEHEQQVTYYELRANGLGERYHQAFLTAVSAAVEAPQTHRLVSTSGIRRVSLRGFPFHVLFRSTEGPVEVLAVAHDRRRPGYWSHRTGNL